MLFKSQRRRLPAYLPLRRELPLLCLRVAARVAADVAPAPEDAADVAVGDSHCGDGHDVGQDEVEDVVSETGVGRVKARYLNTVL